MSSLLDIPREIRDIIFKLVLTATPPIHAHPTATSLLATNHQLHVETKESLLRLLGKGKLYRLDLLLFQEQDLRATWTFLPAHTRHIDTVEVDLRMEGGIPPNHFIQT